MSNPQRSRRYLALLAALVGWIGGAPAQTCVTYEGALGPMSGTGFYPSGIALDGDTAVVGASGDSEGGQFQGAAFVYVRTGGSWSLPTKLVPSGAESQENTGSSVDIDGDILVAGAPGGSTGAAYIFGRSGTTWVEIQRITPSDGSVGDYFGTAVAASNGRIFVGSPSHDTPALGSGAIYVFEPQGALWLETDKLVADDATSSMFAVGLGRSLDAEGNRVATGTGSHAYVFSRSGTTWSQEQKLTPVDGVDDTDNFGGDLSLNGDTLAIGASNGDWNLIPGTGSTFLFQRSGSTWSQTAILNASDPRLGHWFGASVALTDDWLLIGAPRDSDDPPAGGAAYLFRRNGTTWLEETKIFRNPAAGFGMGYGTGVDFDGTTALVAALPGYIPVDVLGVGTPPRTYCTGKTSSVGCIPFASWSGAPSASSTSPCLVRADDLLASEAAFVLYSFSKANLNFHGGKLCVKAPVKRWLPPVIAKSTGSPPCSGVAKRDFNARVQSGVDPSLTAGQIVGVQWRQRDPQDPAGFGDSLTDAVLFTICP